jgi:ABC-type branched-subunit amino acid transport system ATPase component
LTVRENLQIGLTANPRKLRTVPGKVFEYFPTLQEMLDRKGAF